MGFRFRKTIRIAKGLRINVSKSGFSWSAGRKGATVNVGRRGVFGTVGLPGTGLSYRARLASGGRSHNRSVESDGMSAQGLLGALGILAVPVGLIVGLAGSVVGAGLIIGGGALLFFWAVQIQARESAKRAAEAEERAAELQRRFSPDVAARIIAGEVWTGQSAEQLLEALGPPIAVEEKILKTKKKEIWKYDQIGANRFKTRITLDDDVVVTWQRK